MTSKRRLRRRACSNKVAYADQATAVAAQKRLGFGWTTYRCEFCHKWHVGRPNRRGRQSIGAQIRNKREAR